MLLPPQPLLELTAPSETVAAALNLFAKLSLPLPHCDSIIVAAALSILPRQLADVLRACLVFVFSAACCTAVAAACDTRSGIPSGAWRTDLCCLPCPAEHPLR